MRRFALLLLFAIATDRPAVGDESAADVFGLMYWTHRDEGVYRAARDGSELKLLAAVKTADGIAIDRKAQKLYFTVSGYPGPNADKLFRVNLDGSQLEEFVVGLNFTGDLALDEESQKLYLTGVGDGKIFEINIADKSQRDLLTGLVGPDELALDPVNRQLYFTSSGQHKIERVGLDGSGRREIVAGLGTPFGLALDVDQNELYFVEAEGKLRRVKLDGSNLTTLAEGLTQPDGLAFDVDNRKLYWTEKGKLCQANADGTQIETLVSGKSGQYASILILPPKEP